MKIWKLDCDVDHYENLASCGYFDLDLMQSFDGRSKINNWTPLTVEPMHSRKRAFSNTPGFLSKARRVKPYARRSGRKPM